MEQMFDIVAGTWYNEKNNGISEKGAGPYE